MVDQYNHRVFLTVPLSILRYPPLYIALFTCPHQLGLRLGVFIHTASCKGTRRLGLHRCPVRVGRDTMSYALCAHFVQCAHIQTASADIFAEEFVIGAREALLATAIMHERAGRPAATCNQTTQAAAQAPALAPETAARYLTLPISPNSLSPRNTPIPRE